MVAAVVLLVSGGSTAGGAPVARHPDKTRRARAAIPERRGLGNPTASMHPSRRFKVFCFEAHHTAQCNAAALADIDKARAREGLRKLYLPKRFASLSYRRQLLILANHERNVRGLASMGANSALNADAQQGAENGSDPSGPPDYSWGSNISWGYMTPLSADFGWMYDDGTNSPNSGCPHAGASGCWGHRDNILARWHGKQGDGAYDNKGTTQLTELFVQNY
jgi:hypothetical protein